MTDQLPFEFHTTPFEKMWTKELFNSKYQPNSTFRWVDSDNPESAINDEGWTYKFNDYGFRSDSFQQRSEYNILVSGCSITVGIGVDYQYTWPELFKSKIKKQLGKSVSLFNLAQGSCSQDYVVRSIYKTIDFFKPDLVIAAWPPLNRFEFPNDQQSNTVRDYSIYDELFPKLLTDKKWGETELEKNKIFLEMICNTIDSPLICKEANPEIGYYQETTLARDGIHPGQVWHEMYADKVFKEWQNLNSF